MALPELPLDRWTEQAVGWIGATFGGFLDGIGRAVQTLINGVTELLLLLPWPVMLLLAVAAAWRVAGRGLALFSGLALLVVVSLQLWQEAMGTLALVLTSSLLAVGLGVPLGMLAARHDVVDQVSRPLLDMMQTMPRFVYLIPTLMFFGIGPAPAALATVIFAMAPAVRLANLGIRSVPEDVVEAAIAFGATSRQVLVKVQMPMALPSIMTGINQTLMLSLSMAVIAAMIGAGGLGAVVFRSITRVEVGPGFEAGLAIVLLAILLDRLSQNLARPSERAPERVETRRGGQVEEVPEPA